MRALPAFRFIPTVVGWSVHLFTASGACLGLLTLFKIHKHDYQTALWLMAFTLIIDALDGTFARMTHVKDVLPRFDGALLDNLIDYLNYVITPAFFLLVKPGMLPPQAALVLVLALVLTSSYQFCQSEAKTPDHFFKGFPCYWNIMVFYLFILNTSLLTNALVISVLCVFIFIPIKYVYPSRLDYLTSSGALKILMHVYATVYAITSAIVLWDYPLHNPVCLSFSLSYVTIYFFLSFYRTCYPLPLHKNEKKSE